MFELKDKVVLITGATGGIGGAIARKMKEAGATVVVSGRNTAKLNSEFDDSYVKIPADLSAEGAAVELVMDAIEKCGRLDVLVNNAGMTKDGLLLRMSEEDFDAVIDTNLKGCFLFSKACAAIMMKQRSGKIINIASIVGIQGNAGQANYAASKAGIIGFTKSLAKELGSRGINVNAVAPGFVETDMTDVLSDKVKEALMSLIPLKRTAKPEDIAHAIAFLASEKADYITVQVLTVDGGMCM